MFSSCVQGCRIAPRWGPQVRVTPSYRVYKKENVSLRWCPGGKAGGVLDTRVRAHKKHSEDSHRTCLSFRVVLTLAQAFKTNSHLSIMASCVGKMHLDFAASKSTKSLRWSGTHMVHRAFAVPSASWTQAQVSWSWQNQHASHLVASTVHDVPCLRHVVFPTLSRYVVL